MVLERIVRVKYDLGQHNTHSNGKKSVKRAVRETKMVPDPGQSTECMLSSLSSVRSSPVWATQDELATA